MAPVRTRAHPKVDETANRSSSPLKLTDKFCHDVKALLRKVGLRPTRQRINLGWLLFGKGNRHITAEVLHLEAIQAKAPVSLATVYNTLHQFTEAGILRQLAFDGSKSFFDTNTSPHHHFFVERENLLIDIAADDLAFGKIPTPPEPLRVRRDGRSRQVISRQWGKSGEVKWPSRHRPILANGPRHSLLYCGILVASVAGFMSLMGHKPADLSPRRAGGMSAMPREARESDLRGRGSKQRPPSRSVQLLKDRHSLAC